MARDYLDNTAVCLNCGKVLTGVGARRMYCDSKCFREYRKGREPEFKLIPKEVYAAVDNKNCDNCHYFRGVGETRCCHYLLITGHKRPCPPGSKCTVKVKVRVNRRKKRGQAE